MLTDDYKVPDLSGGETRITPSPLTNSIAMFLFVLWGKIFEKNSVRFGESNT